MSRSLARTASAVGVGTTAREHERRAQRAMPVASPTAEAWIKEALDGHCAACGRGPWRSVMGHVVRAHSMTRVDLAEAAGLSLPEAARLFTSQATRAIHMRNSAERWPSVQGKVVEAGKAADHRQITTAGRRRAQDGANALRAWRAKESPERLSAIASAAARTRWDGWTSERRAAVAAASAATRRARSGHGPEFVARVKALRDEGMSQRKIGAALGVTQSYISLLLRRP